MSRKSRTTGTREESAGNGTTAVLVKPLRGEDKVDKSLLDEVVREVNQLHHLKTREFVQELGEYLLGKFFGGSPEQLSSAKVHASWRALAKREDLGVSHSQLWYAVRIAAQMRELPEGVAAALPISHHRRLVGVADPTTKTRLAEKAAKERLTVKEFEAVIAKQRQKDRPSGESRLGRPALPAHIKALRRLPKLVHPLTEAAVSAADVALIGHAQMSALLEQLQEQIDTLSAAKDEITQALAEYSVP